MLVGRAAEWKKMAHCLQAGRALRTVFLVSLLGFTFEWPAQAYVDPGSGSMVIQLLIAGVVGVLFQVRRVARFLGISRNGRKEE